MSAVADSGANATVPNSNAGKSGFFGIGRPLWKGRYPARNQTYERCDHPVATEAGHGSSTPIIQAWLCSRVGRTAHTLRLNIGSVQRRPTRVAQQHDDSRGEQHHGRRFRNPIIAGAAGRYDPKPGLRRDND